MAHFKAAWAADSLNGLKRLNGAGELPRSMVRERLPGRRRRPGSWLQSASTRPLCEYGSCQCTRLTDVSSEAGLCLITAVLEKTARNAASAQRRVPVRPIFLNRLKRGTPRACNLLNDNLSPQTSSFLKVLKQSGPQNPRGTLSAFPPPTRTSLALSAPRTDTCNASRASLRRAVKGSRDREHRTTSPFIAFYRQISRGIAVAIL